MTTNARIPKSNVKIVGGIQSKKDGETPRQNVRNMLMMKRTLMPFPVLACCVLQSSPCARYSLHLLSIAHGTLTACAPLRHHARTKASWSHDDDSRADSTRYTVRSFNTTFGLCRCFSGANRKIRKRVPQLMSYQAARTHSRLVVPGIYFVCYEK